MAAQCLLGWVLTSTTMAEPDRAMITTSLNTLRSSETSAERLERVVPCRYIEFFAVRSQASYFLPMVELAWGASAAWTRSVGILE